MEREPGVLVVNHNWTLDAACHGLPTELFFTPDNAGQGDGWYVSGKTICAICPVRQECLDAAMDEERNHVTYRYGLRGGMTPAERGRFAAGDMRSTCIDCGLPKSRKRSLRCRPCFDAHRAQLAECRHGHPLSGDNVRISSRGYRMCVECTRISDAKRKGRAA